MEGVLHWHPKKLPPHLNMESLESNYFVGSRLVRLEQLGLHYSPSREDLPLLELLQGWQRWLADQPLLPV
jgi:hypothetical protein